MFENFLLLFLKFFILYSLFYLTGRAFVIAFYKQEINVSKNVFFKISDIKAEFFFPIIGLFVIGNIAFIFNFFLPLNNIYPILIFIIFINMMNLMKKFQFFEIKNFLQSTWVFPVLISTSFLISFSYDAGLYHLNNQLWLRESNIVFGFSNIYGPFGVSSLFEYVSALLWFDKSFILLHFLNIFFIGTFYQFLTYNLTIQTKPFLKNSSFILLIFSILDNFGVDGGRNGFLYVQSVGNLDVSLAVLYLITSTLIFNSLINGDFLNTDLKTFLVLSLLLFQLKVSSVPIFIFLVIYFYNFSRKKGLRSSIKNSYFAIILGFLWIIKSVLHSGCIVFPFLPSCLSSLELVDSNYLKATSEVSIAFSKSYIIGENFLIWFNQYIDIPINRTVFYNFLLSFLVILIVNAKNLKKFSNTEVYRYLFIFVFGNILFYLSFGPDVRYIIGFQLFLIGSLGVHIKDTLIKNKKILFLLIASSLLLVPRISNYKIENFKMNVLVETPDYTNDIFNDRTRPSEGDQCWIDIKCSANKLEYNIEQRLYYKIVTIP